jgi:Ca2+-binding EF-hand superfamily protein
VTGGAALAIAVALASGGCASAPDRDARRSAASASRPPRDPRAEHRAEMAAAWRWLAERYDADRDQRITPEEHVRGEESFQRLDRDGDGAVTAADLDCDVVLPPEFGIPLLLPRLLGGPTTDAAPVLELVAGLCALDRGGDGRVDRDEFRAAFGSGAPAGVDGFGTLLAGMDSDHDRLLSRPELFHWLAVRDLDGDGLLATREREVAGPPLRTGFIPPEEREPAPDFAAVDLATGATVLRSALQRRRPMALIFGSFT